MRRIAWSLLGLTWATTSAAVDLDSLQRAEATEQVVVREQVVDAVIEAVHKSTVSSETSGRIIDVAVDVDDYVTKGDVVVRFRDKEQQAALRAAEAQAAEAQSNYNRVKDLVERRLLPRAEFDKAEAALKSANAVVEQARERLERTVVRAPYSGIVMDRHVEPGESASPGTPLVTGLSLESLRAIAEVPQFSIDAVRKLAKSRIIIPTQGDLSVEGVKMTISPYADSNSHTFRVRIDLPQGQHGVYPGMFVKVAFVTGEQTRLLVPTSAVVHRSEVSAVYVLSDRGIRFRQIRVGRELANGQTEVLAGLDPGEAVALDPIRAGVMLKEIRAGKGS
ncbi:MAG: efflux RND transporter periplasmic adaptor subunit [Gammaproteobacteria bacterium]|nr:efflux RND transporter periplasmic adaptor subunit [Gammaproteobacteria bacterium]